MSNKSCYLLGKRWMLLGEKWTLLGKKWMPLGKKWMFRKSSSFDHQRAPTVSNKLYSNIICAMIERFRVLQNSANGRSFLKRSHLNGTWLAVTLKWMFQVPGYSDRKTPTQGMGKGQRFSACMALFETLVLEREL